jgi:hypothetical protein
MKLYLLWIIVIGFTADPTLVPTTRYELAAVEGNPFDTMDECIEAGDTQGSVHWMCSELDMEARIYNE